MPSPRRPDLPVVGFILLVFFVISLLTNSLGALIPEIISSFHLSLATAGLLPFAFFAAYGAMSIPTGLLVERTSPKTVLVVSFAVAVTGCGLFAVRPAYWSALPCLFLIGAAMAALQVVINPALRAAGGEENYAFYSTAAQFVFGIASFLSPGLYALLVRTRFAPAAVPWIILYWVFAAVAAAMFLVSAAVRFPGAPPGGAPGLGQSWRLARQRTVLLYFASIFAYVASEQGTANWISQFLHTYHGVDPRSGGAQAVAGFWGLMTVGCAAGMTLLKFFDGRRVLVGAGLGALATLTVALFGPASWSRLAFPGIGLFASVMWPIIFSLALNSVAEAHDTVAGILCTAIVGGAVLPPLIGQLGDLFGLRAGMLLLYLTFGWVTAVGLWAKPLVNNATLSSKA